MPEVKFTENYNSSSVIRLNQGPKAGFIDRTSFDQKNLSIALWNVLLETDLPDAHFELLFAIGEALAGNHSGMKISVEKLESGRLPRKVYESQSQNRANQIADQVDLAVAGGMKQEAAVEQAKADFKVSRREVFRSLKEVRAGRVAHKTAYADDDLGWDPQYPGFEVGEDGRFVPSPTPT